MGVKEKKILRITLRVPNRETLAEMVQELRLDVGGGGPRPQPDGTLSMEAYVPEEMLEILKKRKTAFEVIEDATKTGKQRQKEVGKHDRFEGGKKFPHGLGKEK
jgi:hypothetical protein